MAVNNSTNKSPQERETQTREKEKGLSSNRFPFPQSFTAGALCIFPPHMVGWWLNIMSIMHCKKTEWCHDQPSQIFFFSQFLKSIRCGFTFLYPKWRKWMETGWPPPPKIACLLWPPFKNWIFFLINYQREHAAFTSLYLRSAACSDWMTIA